MKKKLFGISLLAIGAITLASCGTGTQKADYDNKLTKGNNVDSVTINFKDYSQGTTTPVTISKNDKYTDMVEKLGRTQFGVIHDKDEVYHPYVETCTRESTYEYTNYYFNEVIRGSDGKYKEGNLTSGNKKEVTTDSYNSTIYLHDFSDGETMFYNGNMTHSYNYNYNQASGNISYGEKLDYLNKGAYYKFKNGTDGGMIEYATNREPDFGVIGFELYDDTYNIVEDNYESLYFTGSWADQNKYLDVMGKYKAENYNMFFDTNNISTKNTQTYGCNPLTYSSGDHTSISNGTLLYVPETLRKYYEYSFELTDKYIIIKNKCNIAEYMVNYIAENAILDETRINEILKPYEGSYTYNEVWIDYKNYEELLSKNLSSNPALSFAYYKVEYVDCRNDKGTWNAEDNKYQLEMLQDLNLIGKEWTSKTNHKLQFEVYTIDVDDNTVNNKKNEFINNCKNNNFLDKYNFKKVSR